MRQALLAASIAIFFFGTARADGVTQSLTSKPVDSHLAAALDVLDANGSMNNMNAMLDAMAPIEAQEIKRETPTADDATIAAAQKLIHDALVAREDEYKQMVAAVYESNFTEEELKTLAAFYRSDVGKKYITTVPTIIKEMIPLATLWTQRVMQDVTAKASQGLKSKGDRT